MCRCFCLVLFGRKFGGGASRLSVRVCRIVDGMFFFGFGRQHTIIVLIKHPCRLSRSFFLSFHSFRYSRGCLEEALNDCARPMQDGSRLSRCLIITDKVMGMLGYVDRVKDTLVNEGFMVSVFDDVNPDPDMDTVRRGVLACQQFQPDLMICLGGGSPMDAGKFIRAKYECPELSVEDAAARFLELRKRTCPFPTLGSKIHKLVCIPTTSGTASEVTPFSVITDDEETSTHVVPVNT
jgi:alcohol dehydrogenase class IV